MSLQPEPETHPVSRVKAPWTLKAESYLMFLRMKELPKGVYDGLEEVWGGDEYGKFEGGLGAIMIVRYSDTPVGMSFSFHCKVRFSRTMIAIISLPKPQLSLSIVAANVYLTLPFCQAHTMN
jgi:hypothetical protein